MTAITPQMLAGRVLDALPTVRRQVVVRDRCGRSEIVDAVVAEARRRGIETVVELRSNEVLEAHLAASTVADWTDEACAARGEFTFGAEATITLGGWRPKLSQVDPAVVDAWLGALHRADQRWTADGELELAVAVPGPSVAHALGTTVEALDATVLPAVCCPAVELEASVASLIGNDRTWDQHVLRTPGAELRLRRGHRTIHVDDGMIDAADVAGRAVVSNLPGGSAYWTVLEHETRGTVRVADGTILTFGSDGAVTDGPYAGERISHVGVGANPHVGAPIGWTLVDEHRVGAVFLALGENRYMGGANASAVNVDLLPLDGVIVTQP